MKRLLLLLACLLALCTTVVAAEPAISDMKTDCTLTGSGACQVTQTFTMEIDGAQTQLRFPLVPGAKKASVAGYDAQKQTDGDCPVLVLSDASGFTGTRSFTVLYTVSGLVSEADGVQTLQLPLLSAKWAYPISRYQFTVTMPKPFEGYPAFVSGYYSDVISDYIDLDVSESLISGTIATGLKDHESLDMTLTLDKSYFSGAYTALSFSWVGMAVIVALLTLAQFGEGLLAVLLVIVCLVLLGLLTLHGGRRTAFGDEIVTQAMSYRRFLRRVTQSQLLSRLAQDSQYFYRILPYAEAIGLGAGLARTLGNTELEQCDWYQEQQPLPRTAAGFYSHLQEALALLELSIRK